VGLDDCTPLRWLGFEYRCHIRGSGKVSGSGYFIANGISCLAATATAMTLVRSGNLINTAATVWSRSGS
jgi:hypothetical protein